MSDPINVLTRECKAQGLRAYTVRHRGVVASGDDVFAIRINLPDLSI